MKMCYIDETKHKKYNKVEKYKGHNVSSRLAC